MSDNKETGAPNIIPVIEYGGTLPLHFHKENKTFTIEDSDLQLADIPKRVTIKVLANGHTKDFIGVKRIENREGEVLWWEYQSIGGGELFTLKIFND